MRNINYENKTLKLPNNTELPFFAYGIFKPGQLAYSKINNHVFEKLNDIEINYPMKTRDGVPILKDKESSYSHTKGSIITFREGQEETAYDIVCKTLLRKLYRWKTIKIDGKEVNVLFGVNPDNGSYEIEDPKERVSFDGKNDPLFYDAVKLIEKNLDEDKDRWKIESFFELQMNYMLLWTAIDRYSSLKYNKQSQNKNHERFARQKAFKKGIRKFKDEFHQPVYSTDDLRMHEFNEEDPIETLYYYYTIRCNVVHRGKAMIGDYHMLETALKELLEIFNDVLENTFDK